MEKLIEKYNEECSLESKMASRLWKCSQIIVLIVFIILGVIYHNLWIYVIGFIVFLISTIILWLICTRIEINYMSKKLNIEKTKYKGQKEMRASRELVYGNAEKFQKDWITNYCKRNRINTIEKLKILKDEIQRKQDKTKYLNPVIIGTLLVIIWERLVENIDEISGFINCIVVSIFLAVIISIVVTWICKEWKEQIRFLNEFKKYSRMERLEELLVYRMLREKK